jgi:5-hydroxyisourate hydrolase
MKGKLSTHVLDIQNGRPAAGLSIALWRLHHEERALLKHVFTNVEGRTDTPLLDGSEMRAGEYELVFQVGSYFGIELEKSFLNEVPVRFRIVDPKEGYHVPLLVSPWAYSTYRGS